MLRALGRFLRFTALLCLLILFLAFCVANRGVVMLTFFPFNYTAELPVFLALLVFFTSGALIGGLLVQRRLIGIRRALSLEKQRAELLHNEVQVLRAESTAKPLVALS